MLVYMMNIIFFILLYGEDSLYFFVLLVEIKCYIRDLIIIINYF